MGKKITMFSTESSSIQERFEQYLSAASAKGLSSKTLKTYRQHFHCTAPSATLKSAERRRPSTNFNMILGTILSIVKTAVEQRTPIMFRPAIRRTNPL